MLNKVKVKDIYFKVEIWIDFRESDLNTTYFKTKEEQDKVLFSLKQSFVNAINQSYADSKGSDPLLRTIEVAELKFENHHNETQNQSYKKKPSGGGYGGGGDRRGKDKYHYR